MTFDSSFEDFFSDFGLFDTEFFKKLQQKMNQIVAEAKNDASEEIYEFREIKEPGINGFVIIGRFGTNRAIEGFQPLKPQKRKPKPGNPFELREIEEAREPLTDIYEQEDLIKIYVELPGEEEKNIVLTANQKGIEIKAKRFHKTISLNNDDLSTDKMTTRYKNGVLEVTIPRKGKIQK